MFIGEQVIIGLLVMVLKDIGCQVKSYIGGQVKVLIDSMYIKVCILLIDEVNMWCDFDVGNVVVVVGF